MPLTFFGTTDLGFIFVKKTLQKSRLFRKIVTKSNKTWRKPEKIEFLFKFCKGIRINVNKMSEREHFIFMMINYRD